MPYPETVHTEHLILRRWGARDRGAWLAVWADPSVWRELRPDEGPDPVYALQRFDDQFAHWEEHGFGSWAVIDRETRVIAGRIGASHPTFVPEVAHEIEIGWALRRPFWGRVYATEGARAAVAATFEHLRPPRVISLIERSNVRSVAVARRLGMRQDGDVAHPEARQLLGVYSLSAGAGGEPPAARSDGRGRPGRP